MAKSLNVKVSCDLNYRANLWKYGATPSEVMPNLVTLTDVLLGDATAFEVCLGTQQPADAPPESWLESVQVAYPRLQHIAMTQREGFSASHNTYQGVLRCGGTTFFSKKHDLPDMLDRIGGGDAFMAGLIFGLQKNEADLQETVEFATAAAALKHYIAGDFNLCSEAEVQDLMAGNLGGRVRR